MKKSIEGTVLCGLLFLSVVGCATTESGVSAGTNSEAASAPAEVSLEPVILEGDAELVVFGLSCPLCASNLGSQLRNIPGVAGHQIDLETGIVQVQVRRGAFVQSAALRAAVKDAGFTLQEIRLKEGQ